MIILDDDVATEIGSGTMSVELPKLEWSDPEAMFPSLFAAAAGRSRQMNALHDSLNAICVGQTDGAIRNAVYVEAKDSLSRRAYDAWGTIRDSYYAAYRGGETAKNQAISDLFMDASLGGLSDIRFLAKKIAKAQKAGATGPTFDAIVAFERELAPLAHLVTAMKGITVKGRAPSTKAVVHDNPDQVRGACACCFSNQAVVGAHMAHHGYQRPTLGFQTASCPGVGFQPFEKSPMGTSYMVDACDAEIRRLSRLIEKAPHLEKLMIKTGLVVRGPDGRHNPEMVTITPTDGRWERSLTVHLSRLVSRKESVQRDREAFDARLAAWAPAELYTVTGHPAPEGTGGTVYTGAIPGRTATAPEPHRVPAP